jgi:hypothetical protein
MKTLGDIDEVIMDADGRPVLIDVAADDPVTIRWGLMRQLESYLGREGEAIECMALALKLRQSPKEIEDAEAALLKRAVEGNGKRFPAILQAPLLRFVQGLT